MKMEIKNKQRGCLCNHFHPPLPQLIPPGKVLLIAPIAHGDSGVVQCSAVFVWLACVITMSRKSFGSLSFLPEFHLSPPHPTLPSPHVSCQSGVCVSLCVCAWALTWAGSVKLTYWLSPGAPAINPTNHIWQCKDWTHSPVFARPSVNLLWQCVTAGFQCPGVFPGAHILDFCGHVHTTSHK